MPTSDILDHAITLSQQALVTAWTVLLPMLGATLIVGLLVGVFQATTQIQEQTLSFAPKLLVLTDFASQDLGGFWQYIVIH